MVSISLNLNYKLSFLPSSISRYPALILFCPVLKMKPKMDRSVEACILRTTVMCDVRNVPLSKVVTMQIQFKMMHHWWYPLFHAPAHRNLLEPLVVHKTLYSLSFLVSVQLFFWMNAPPLSYKLLFLREEWCTVSTQCHLLSFPACLLPLWYQSFLISRRHGLMLPGRLEGRSPPDRGQIVAAAYYLHSTGCSTPHICIFSSVTLAW